MPQPANDLKIRFSSIGDLIVETPAPAPEGITIDPSELKISYKVSVEVNRPASKVIIVVSIMYFLGEQKLFSGKLTNCFDVVSLASYITEQEGGQFRIESDFLPMLISVSFSSARGYFACALKDSALAAYPFPMVSLDNVQKRTSYHLV